MHIDLHLIETIFICSFIYNCITCVIACVLLSRLLAPKLDPIFKEDLRLIEVNQSVPSSILRANVYACWITFPKIFAARNYKVQKFDFSPFLNGFTYTLCWVQGINNLMAIVFVIVGLIIPIRRWLGY